MDDGQTLRRGWTTGACATAAAKAAFIALRTGAFPDPVDIDLPRGGHASFALAETHFAADGAMAAVVKDAGDDPDVTHGALIRVHVRLAAPGTGLVFRAGAGVGTVTRAGLPLPPGEPAINPVPRQMIRDALASVAGGPVDAEVVIGVDDGERLALRTLNGRLGIVGGLSILGTTGIVVPYSCAAWIDSIHRGIDVARAAGLDHIAGATGSTSEAAVARRYGLPEIALIEMGDFVGGMLRYLRRHPVPRVTIAGGVAKMAKLAQGRLDLHNKRGAVDFPALASLADVPEIAAANTAAEAFAMAAARGVPLGDRVAALAWRTARAALDRADIVLDIVLFDREGRFVASHDGAAGNGAPHDLNRRG